MLAGLNRPRVGVALATGGVESCELFASCCRRQPPRHSIGQSYYMNAMDVLLFTFFAAAVGGNVWLYEQYLRTSRKKARAETHRCSTKIHTLSAASLRAVLAWTAAYLVLRLALNANISLPLGKLPAEDISERVSLLLEICGVGVLTNGAISLWPLLTAYTRGRQILPTDVISIAISIASATYVCWQLFGHALPFFRPVEA